MKFIPGASHIYGSHKLVSDAVVHGYGSIIADVINMQGNRSGGEPTKVECNYIWANVITFAQM